MDAFAAGLTTLGKSVGGVNVVRFEFPYMAKRREGHGRRPPDRAPILQETVESIAGQLRKRWPRRGLVIGGKSMGGRIASMLADTLRVDGLVCLGYPFHPLGKPDRLRVQHLQDLKTPALFCQGTRDALGSETEVATYRLSPAIRVHWLADGDHSFKPRKASGYSLESHYQDAQQTIIEFIAELPRRNS